MRHDLKNRPYISYRFSIRGRLMSSLRIALRVGRESRYTPRLSVKRSTPNDI